MILRVTAAGFLILGIALGVLATFFGVERQRGEQIKRPHPALNVPALAAALTAWGLVGYSLERFGVRPIWAAVAATVAAALAWIGMGALLAKWALRAPLEDPHEMAEMLQGHVAMVTSGIDGDSGAITYQLKGRTHVVRARSIDGSPILEGTDVVIERIDDDVAYVEPWSLVEKRI
jgi:membrane protein implicated in regulation of membrane protease activity